MHLARAVGCEGSVIGVDLGGPEHVRIVFGAVDGIQQSARLFLCLFEQRRERGDVLIGLTRLDGSCYSSKRRADTRLCPYRMSPSYASHRPASRPDLYEFILV